MKKILMTLLMVFSLPVSALAEKLVFVTTWWPPYMIVENGQITGIHVEVVQELCKRLGFEPDIQAFPWKRAMKYMKTGRADAIFTPRRTQEREKFLYYPAESLHTDKTVILARRGSGIKATKLDDLSDKLIGMVRGYSYGSELTDHPDLKKVICDDDEQMIKIFSKKRIDLATGADEGSMKYLFRKAGIDTEVVYGFIGDPSYLAFSKASKGERGKILADKFGQALRQLKKEGVIEKLESKYF